jgi:hypothetical protein
VQYTNEFGKRAVSSWQMSADESAKYKDAVPVPGTREIRGISRVDERLQPLAKHVREGRFFESPWQLIRFRSLEGISDEDAVRTIAAWCKRQGFEMSFVTRLRLLSSGSDGRRHPIRPPTFLMAHAPRALNQGSAIVAGDCSHTSPVSLSRTASLLKASNTVNRWAGAAPYPSSA